MEIRIHFPVKNSSSEKRLRRVCFLIGERTKIPNSKEFVGEFLESERGEKPVEVTLKIEVATQLHNCLLPLRIDHVSRDAGGSGRYRIAHQVQRRCPPGNTRLWRVEKYGERINATLAAANTVIPGYFKLSREKSGSACNQRNKRPIELFHDELLRRAMYWCDAGVQQIVTKNELVVEVI